MYKYLTEMIRQAEKVLAEGRTMNGVFYSIAKLFIFQTDLDKVEIYDKFIDLKLLKCLEGFLIKHLRF